jgi:cob(I)alamin adenosyltransferase
MTEQSETAEEHEHREKMQALKARQDAEVRSKTIKRGVLIVNTGNGKGKSTAAFGVAMRAAGHGQRVGIVQFIKGTWKTGEGAAFGRFPEITHVVAGDGFTWETQNRAEDIARTRAGFERAKTMILGTPDAPPFDLVVLDELNIVLKYDYLPLQEVLDVLRQRPEAQSIVVTGRDAPPELVAIADTVTEMTPVKHAYAAGIRARKGVEF